MAGDTYSTMPSVEGGRHFADVVVQLQLLQLIVGVLVDRAEVDAGGIVDATLEAIRRSHRLRVILDGSPIDEDERLTGEVIERRVRVHALIFATLWLLTSHVDGGAEKALRYARAHIASSCSEHAHSK